MGDQSESPCPSLFTMRALPALLLLLNLLTGVSSLSGPAKVTMYTQSDYKINYTYNRNYYFTHKKYWCQGYYKLHCNIRAYAGDAVEGRNVIVEDNKQTGSITVTIKKPQLSDAGDYWCGIEKTALLDVMTYTRVEVMQGSAPQDSRVKPPVHYIVPFSLLGLLVVLVPLVLLGRALCRRRRTADTGGCCRKEGHSAQRTDCVTEGCVRAGVEPDGGVTYAEVKGVQLTSLSPGRPPSAREPDGPDNTQLHYSDIQLL
ncbi:CMRF35-like molecule 8 isoform X2 [Amia ocellicauda]|uniref:CMRF35-like molecule 8 isoform X2 n=1 Tax=Amia ocellicauda TaxID=2972642 RepID=UPI003464540E|nr:CLM5 protein [Amia calva]